MEQFYVFQEDRQFTVANHSLLRQANSLLEPYKEDIESILRDVITLAKIQQETLDPSGPKELISQLEATFALIDAACHTKADNSTQYVPAHEQRLHENVMDALLLRAWVASKHQDFQTCWSDVATLLRLVENLDLIQANQWPTIRHVLPMDFEEILLLILSDPCPATDILTEFETICTSALSASRDSFDGAIAWSLAMGNESFYRGPAPYYEYMTYAAMTWSEHLQWSTHRIIGSAQAHYLSYLRTLDRVYEIRTNADKDFWQRCIESLTLDAPEFDMSGFGTPYRDWANWKDRPVIWLSRPRTVFAEMLLGRIGIVTGHTRCAAELSELFSVLRVLLAALQHYGLHSEFPENISDLIDSHDYALPGLQYSCFSYEYTKETCISLIWQDGHNRSTSNRFYFCYPMASSQ